QKAARSSYRLDKVVEDSIDAILATSITLIRTFDKWQVHYAIKPSLSRFLPDG
ncbi:hypothetical protein J2Z81_003119, partial [Virgibacillus campisalis]|nr:hypothetical protein [Virgibacillus alimentarius]